MTDQPELEKSINEVHRKIGRNLLALQKFELNLKYFIFHSRLYSSESEDQRLKRKNDVGKKMMGQLIDPFIENVLSSDPIDEGDDASIEKAKFSFKFQVDMIDESNEETQEKLSEIVSERNELVHNLLQSYNLHSITGCAAAQEHLDKQFTTISVELSSLQQLVKNFQYLRTEILEMMESGELWRKLDKNSG